MPDCLSQRVIALILGALTVLGAPAFAAERFAAIVAVETYSGDLPPAAGATEDAAYVDGALRARGFETRTFINADQTEFNTAISWLASSVREGEPGSTAILYFVGHGLQFYNETYLLAPDTPSSNALVIPGRSIAVTSMIERLTADTDGLSPRIVLVFDAGAPMEVTRRLALDTGIGSFDPPSGGAVILSNMPGRASPVRPDAISTFARSFADDVVNSDASLETSFRTLRRKVSNATNAGQQPWKVRDAPRRFVLAPTPIEEAALRPVAPAEIVLDAAPSAEITDTGMELATGIDRIQEVEVYFGTDRKLETTQLGARFVAEAEVSNALSFGVATVTIPPTHRTGELERPNWIRLEFREDPQKHVVLKSTAVMAEYEFFNDLRAEVNRSDARQAFVFVHGYNTTFNEAARRTAQLHHDLDFDGAPIFYSWPSRGVETAYLADQSAADRTVKRLREFLTLIKLRTGADRIHLIAHSMGNRVLIKALEEISADLQFADQDSVFNEIILSAPDIRRSEFEHVARQIRGVGERITLYASSNDRALQIARTFGDPEIRAGDSSAGVVVAPGVDSIDATNARTEIFGFNHSYFAEAPSILSDVRLLLTTGASPDARDLDRLAVSENPDGQSFIIWEMRTQR